MPAKKDPISICGLKRRPNALPSASSIKLLEEVDDVESKVRLRPEVKWTSPTAGISTHKEQHTVVMVLDQ